MARLLPLPVLRGRVGVGGPAGRLPRAKPPPLPSPGVPGEGAMAGIGRIDDRALTGELPRCASWRDCPAERADVRRDCAVGGAPNGRPALPVPRLAPRGRGGALAVIECGAGTAVPTVRLESERVRRAARGNAGARQRPRAAGAPGRPRRRAACRPGRAGGDGAAGNLNHRARSRATPVAHCQRSGRIPLTCNRRGSCARTFISGRSGPPPVSCFRNNSQPTTEGRPRGRKKCARTARFGMVGGWGLLGFWRSLIGL